MLKEIEQRQSIRKYLNKPVEPEKILELLKAAMNAPTARNTQEWKFKVITNSQALNDMTKLSPYTTIISLSKSYSQCSIGPQLSILTFIFSPYKSKNATIGSLK